MQKVPATTSVTIDNTTYSVEQMSKECQKIIGFLDDLRQREADATTELLIIHGALRDAQNQLLAQVYKEQEAAKQDSTKQDKAPEQ